MRKNILLALALLVLAVPLWAQTEDIVDRLDKALGVTLPDGYRQKVKDFVHTNNVLKDEGTAQFTEQFILEEMKKDWKISRQNQLLFIWHSIYYQITDSNLYDGRGVDDNERRIDEFNSKGVTIRIRASGSKYKLSCITYMEQRSAEAKQRSAEAKQRSAEAARRSAEANRRSAEAARRSAEANRRSAEAIKHIMAQDTIWVKEKMPEFYDLYKRNPVNIKQVDLTFMIESTKDFIAQCKEYNIDYRAILLKELGDKKKVDEMLKFYGVE